MKINENFEEKLKNYKTRNYNFESYFYVLGIIVFLFLRNIFPQIVRIFKSFIFYLIDKEDLRN